MNTTHIKNCVFNKSVITVHNCTILKKQKTKNDSIKIHILTSCTWVQTLKRAEPTSVDEQCFLHHTGWGDKPGAPQHTHTYTVTHSHSRTWTDISHTSFLLYPSILRAYIRGRTARIKTLPTLVSLPPTSLTLWCWDTSSSSSAQLNTLNPAFLSFAFITCPPRLPSFSFAHGLHF